jgi:ABC-type multidrug transport system ATPase subunit
MLARLKRQGITILVSTPYMDEAARCDRIALMRSGHYLTIDTPEAICAAFDRKLYAARSGSMYALLGDLRSYAATVSCYAFGDAHHLTLASGEADIPPLLAWLHGRNHTDVVVEPILPSIEDCFMALGKEDV